MQNLGGQTKSIMVFSGMANNICSQEKVALAITGRKVIVLFDTNYYNIRFHNFLMSITQQNIWPSPQHHKVDAIFWIFQVFFVKQVALFSPS